MGFPVADGMTAGIFTISLWKCMEAQVHTIKVCGLLGSTVAVIRFSQRSVVFLFCFVVGGYLGLKE